MMPSDQVRSFNSVHVVHQSLCNDTDGVVEMPQQELEELLNKLPSEDRQRWLHSRMPSKVSLSVSNIMFWFKFDFTSMF